MPDATETSRGSAGSGWPTSPEPIGEEAVREAQRQRILRASIDVIAKRGYNETSAERICREAGVSFPTFRNSFRDKEEAFLAAFDEAIDAGRSRVAEAMAAAEEDWTARALAGLGAILELIAEDPARARLCLVEALTAGAAGIDRYEAAVALCIPGLREGHEQAGRERPPVPLLEETIVGGVAWTLHQKVAAGEAGGARELFEALAVTVLRPYLGEGEAERLARRQSAQA
jgi:AcrR family transcriptional regulator